MPTRTINPFASNSPTSTPSLDVLNEKREQPRRTSFTKGNKFTALFGGSTPRSRSEAAVLREALVAQQQALLDSPSPSSAPLPTINLVSATAEKMPTEQKTLFQPPDMEEERRIARMHAQFGPLNSQSHRYVSKFEGEFGDPVEDEPPYYFLLTTYISYLILIVFGHVRDFFGKRFRKAHYSHLAERDGYAPLNSDFDNFYTRRLKMRLNDCFSRPIIGVPGRFITLLDRTSNDGNYTFKLTGTSTETLNMSSYNYLGFAQSEGPCADSAEQAIRKYGISMASPRADAGTSELTLEVEDLIARFVEKPAAMVFSMGFVTNATVFSTILGKGCLLLSDELNHSSIRFGSRLCGCMISTFKHNDMRELEKTLREAISQGQPRTHRPWKKIVVAVEGLYSMEGTMCNLPALVELKQKYKFNLFVDEAHSIGAVGPRGRGVCDFFDIDPSEIDILMGTLTKSFGANGGYLAADEHIIRSMKTQNAAMLFAETPTPPVLVQIASALRIISGELVPGQGEERLQRLIFNSRYLRLGLKRLGFIVYGHDDSPIIPVMLYNPAKMPAFSHEMLKRKISVVVVGYPATPLVSSRARFCISAAHNKDDLDRMLAACDEIGDLLQLKFSSGVAGGADREEIVSQDNEGALVKAPRWKLEDVIKRGVEDVQFPLQ
ncbi:serine palmitoyltransferas-like protein 2 [Massarina eburnea CBS 473.64]|uniref:Serine palmitoyltransferas-like protein 2 n=1 Tax=Massarina eburnea CBS 473.64 TaxID=1395130 RepID=A0A6A6SHD0_9PLEO|nr:serine palmitoyltransferas-like protein 2 [Massarina eburnea CBS 473.64]